MDIKIKYSIFVLLSSYLFTFLVFHENQIYFHMNKPRNQIDFTIGNILNVDFNNSQVLVYFCN